LRTKNHYIKASAAMAVTLFIAGCGGGGGGGGSTAPSLQISGTVASGQAIANASVTAQCATGTGSATSGLDGIYAINIPGGALPCLLKATGTTPAGLSVTLHSAADAGTASGNGTTATANIDQVTELATALFAGHEQQYAQLLSQAASFHDQFQQAIQSVTAALQPARIDLSGLNPFTSPLVAANGTQAGNAHDQLLDALAAKIPLAALPLVVNQIVVAADAGSPIGLQQLTAAASGGALYRCPYALSGQYRTIDRTGLAEAHKVDFGAFRFYAANGTDSYGITPDATNACQFNASGTVNGILSSFDFVVAASGMGAYRKTDATGTTLGVIFPAQQTTLQAVAGTWTYVGPANDTNTSTNGVGQFTIDTAAGTLAPCVYVTLQGNLVCFPAGSPYTVTARSDGGYDAAPPSNGSGNPLSLWGYTAPGGATALFGTFDVAGVATLGDTLIAAKLAKLDLPAVGAVTNYWDLEMSNVAPGATVAVAGPTAQSTTILTADSGTSTVARRRTSDARVDSVQYNQPLDGFRLRAAGSTFAQAQMMALPGMGLNVSIDTFADSSVNPHFFVISVNRP